MITHCSVYSTQHAAEFQVCRTDDLSLYAAHVYAFLESATHACPTRAALEIDGLKITYEELSSKIGICASCFMTLGIEPGDVVLFSMSCSSSLIIALLAALRLGAKICLLPENISVLRLRAIQKSLSIALLVHDETPNVGLDVCGFHVQSVTYSALISRSVSSCAADIYPSAFLSAAQVLISYDSNKGFYPLEFSQSVFLKMLHEMDDIVPAQQSSERMLMKAFFTNPLFLLDLFYVFMRQSTAVFPLHSDTAEACPIKLPVVGTVRGFLEECGWFNVTGLESKGLPVSLGELEYFAKQYPGVIYAKANFSGSSLELHVKLAWDFYPYPFVYAVDLEKLRPASDIDYLAFRLHDFLSRHMWGDLPLRTLVLEADHLDSVV